MGKKSSKNADKKILRKMKTNSKLFKDTNCLYPPNLQYENANNEMKSPPKKRPLSGDPSPDKFRI
jgi:hypothetical protein